MDTPEGTQVGTERCARPLTGVAMDLAATIPIVIPCPFAHPVGHRGMARMAPTITLPFIGIEPRATGGHVGSNKNVAGLPVRMVADPPALLARVARDDADDGGPIVDIGAVALALIGASFRRPPPSTAYSTHRTPDSGRPGNILVRGTGAARCSYRGGM